MWSLGGVIFHCLLPIHPAAAACALPLFHLIFLRIHGRRLFIILGARMSHCAGEDAEFALQPADEYYLLVLLNDPKLNSLAGCNYVCCFFKGTHYYILQCSPLMCFSFALRHALEPGWEKNNRYTLLIYSRNLYLLLLFLRSKGFLLFDKYLLLICCFLCAQFITKNVARPHGARKILPERKSPCVKPAVKNWIFTLNFTLRDAHFVLLLRKKQFLHPSARVDIIFTFALSCHPRAPQSISVRVSTQQLGA